MTKERYIQIGNRNIGSGYPAFIIAETGSNHDGSLEKAKSYIKKAANIGADAVKFQTIHLDKLLATKVIQDGKIVTNPAKANAQFISLPDEWYPELFDYAKALGLVPFSTPFDLDSVDMLLSAGAEVMKIASGDVTYLDLIRKVGDTGKLVLLSTGMCNLGEVEVALKTLYATGNRQVVLLHCVSNYPTNYEEVNLRAILTMRAAFKTPVGLSDHTPGLTSALGAVAMGACVIEKHITFSRTSPGTDHFFAMEFPEFEQMIQAIRDLEASLGDGRKSPSAKERERVHRVRRGIYATSRITKGETIQADDMVAMRPQNDYIKPISVGEVVGLKAPRDFQEGEPLSWSDFRAEL